MAMMRSGYSSRILEMSSVPSPEPVPPPRLWSSSCDDHGPVVNGPSVGRSTEGE